MGYTSVFALVVLVAVTQIAALPKQPSPGPSKADLQTKIADWIASKSANATAPLTPEECIQQKAIDIMVQAHAAFGAIHKYYIDTLKNSRDVKNMWIKVTCEVFNEEGPLEKLRNFVSKGLEDLDDACDIDD